MQWEKLYYVGADAQQSGIMQGELAAEAIKSNDQIDRNNDEMCIRDSWSPCRFCRQTFILR